VKYLLDTNAVIALLKGDARLLTRLRQHRPGDFAIPAIAAHELFYGAFKGHRVEDNLARVEALRLAVLEFDREDARRAGALRAHLAVAGTQIGPYDVLIAGQALARDLTLITHNVREFARAPGLLIEDWQASDVDPWRPE
jgi:tRNA(fMet)-specific endonuclease VapC